MARNPFDMLTNVNEQQSSNLSVKKEKECVLIDPSLLLAKRTYTSITQRVKEGNEAGIEYYLPSTFTLWVLSSKASNSSREGSFFLGRAEGVGIDEVRKFIEEMGKELRLFGTTIPMDKKQEIVNWVFKNIQNLYDGVYNYKRIWKTRYNNYLEKSPDSPVIEKFQSMAAALEFIKKIKILKEELENAKNGK